MKIDHIQIRKAVPGDINGIFELERLWEEEGISYEFEPITREEFIKQMKENSEYHLVAEEEGVVIGYINGIIEKEQNKKKFGVVKEQLSVENIYIKKEYRNKQLGSRLLTILLKKAREGGIKTFKVASDTKDLKAVIRFYERHGFKPYYVKLLLNETGGIDK